MDIYALSTLFNGNEMVRQLLARGVKVKGVIGLAEHVSREGISGYEDPRAFCARHGLAFIPADSYGLTQESDRERLTALSIDVALVLGWQRLVPDWLLDHCNLGAIGVHGSADGITGGRGRSPQNWALMLGKDAFHLSIFFADPGVDSGPIIDSLSIPLTLWDDIRTSHYKVGRATVDMLVRNFENGRIAARASLPQAGESRYLPQRRPEDGAIDFTRSSAQLYDFVRALTRPYPGAFAGNLRLWRARPFAAQPAMRGKPGEILDRFENGELLIATGDGALFVDDYAWEGEALPVGAMLPSASWAQQMHAIAARHSERYPDMPLIPEIAKFL